MPEAPVVDQATPASAAPVTTAPPASWDNFQITDEQFKAAGFDDTDLHPETAAASPATAPPPTVVTPAAAPVEPPVEAPKDVLDLSAIGDDPAPPVPPAPTLTPEQTAILKMFPNTDIANMGVQGFQLTNAFMKGDFQGMLNALKEFNPQAFQSFEESIYKEKMPTWVDRYIAENDPNHNPREAALAKRIETMENLLKQAARQNLSTQQTQQYQQKLSAIDGEITGLFDKVKFTDANGFDAKDRSFVMDAIHKHLASNPQDAQKALQGNLSVLRPIFRQKINDYVERDKARAEKLRHTQTTQTTEKKLPLQAAGISTETASTGKDAFFEKAAAWVKQNETA